MAAAVVVHPHPAMGGDSSHPLIVAITDGLIAKGVDAVRPNLRDPQVGASAAALEEIAAGMGAERLFLVGYSWGSVVTSLAAPDALAARVLIAPPVGMLAVTKTDDVPTLVLVPAHDQYGGPDAVNDAMGDWARATIEVVESADHFLMGAVDRVATRVVGWLTELAKSGRAPAS